MRSPPPEGLILIALAGLLSSAGCGAPVGRSLAWSENEAAAAALWKSKQLDLDVHIDPAARTLRLEGEQKLLLEGDTSSGPTLFVNARRPVFGFNRLEGPAGTMTHLNGFFPAFPSTRFATVKLPEAAVHGQEVTLKFQCAKYAESFQVVARPNVALASWVEAWYPIVPPNGAVGLTMKMAVPGRTRFHVPRNWDVASNGKLVGRRETDQGAVVEWEADPPVARSFAAGPYHVARHSIGGREVGVYLLSASPDGAREQAETLGRALQAMEERMGPYPYPTYAIAEVPRDAVFWYASSEQGFIMARSDAFEHGPNLPLFAHEMAHGWWGNLVNQSGPGSILCSESLAQYCAVLAIEATEGQEEATRFLRFSRAGYNSQQCAKGYFEMVRKGADAPLSQLTDQRFAHDLSDAKGHWVYHMLRGRIGDDTFFAVLRGLIRDFSGKDMKLDDIRRAFITAAAPEAELERFFADWLDRTGAPVVELEWESAAEDRGAIDVVLKQVQSGETYLLDIELAIKGKEHETRQTVRMHDRELRTRLQSPEEPTEVRLDPAHRLLIWDPEYGPKPK